MELNYLLREPENIHSDTPLLILLHGYGSNEQDLFTFRQDIPKDWMIMSFRAPITLEEGRYAWYNIDQNPQKGAPINLPQAHQAIDAIHKSIKELQTRYGISGEVHLCGFSQGGILSYALGLKHPELFTTIAILSAYPEMNLLNKIKFDKKKLKHLRYFVSHGTEDAIIPLEWAQKGAEFLYEQSVFFRFREYMMGHGISKKSYRDLLEFWNLE